jgi:hypothetical protein
MACLHAANVLGARRCRCPLFRVAGEFAKLDNREVVAGSTLFIPIFVRGALFEIGNGHAAQGDGEVSQTAIETSLRGRVQLTVRTDMKLTWPRAGTACDYISMGPTRISRSRRRSPSKRWWIF